MSGIVGLFDRDGNGGPDPSRVETMHERIAHRGPDGGNTWRDDRVGLGHQLLASTPEASHERQPRRASADRACDAVVTANLRLDNREELLSACDLSDEEAPGDRDGPDDRDVAADGTGAVDGVATDEETAADAATETDEPARDDAPVTDPELLLAAYERWGTDCVEHLIGAFAFAIWDADRERLFCARDHFGVKPFYYRATDGGLAFASEPKAILALPSVDPTLDERKVGDFLTGMFEDKTNTFYESIRRLEPAHAMVVDAAGVETWQYWDLDPTRTLTLESDAAYERRFRELFEQAVGDCLRTEDPVGTTLSGGLDSSSITAVANDLQDEGETLRTYSGVFEDAPGSDEREYIETLVDRDGIESTYVFMDGVPLLVDYDDLLEHADAPVHNTMHHLKWETTKRARDDGVGILLDGAHGDSAVDYGLGYLPQLFRTGRWHRVIGELRAMSEVLDVPPHLLFVRFVLPTLIPRTIRHAYYGLRGTPVLEERANPALDESFVERTDMRARHEALDDEGSVWKRSARRWQRRSLLTGSMTAFLEANDQLCAAFGVEPRYPFIDVRLIEYTMAIPPTQQLKDGWTRSILRRSVGDVLPEKIQWRSWKTTMNEAFADALGTEDDRVRALVEDPGPLANYLDADALRGTYERFQDEPSHTDARVLWTALSLSVWLEDAPAAPRSSD